MIQFKEIDKQFKEKVVLSDINLTIDVGSVYCLLGKNGAGKSTLLNILLDLVKPTQGEVLIFGKSYQDHSFEIKQNTGSMIESVPIVETSTAKDYLTFIALLYELPISIAKERITDLLKFFFEEEEVENKLIDSFSTGMKKKMALCASLLNNPQLLIWDEPFAGLDPVSAQRLVDFIKFYAVADKILLISSHDLNYVNQIATHLGVLAEGKLVYNGTYSDFTGDNEKSIESEVRKYLHYELTDTSSLSWMKA